MTWHSTQSHYTDTGLTSSSFSMLSANEKAANTIFKVFGMTRPGIEPTTCRTQIGRSSNWATVLVGSKVIGLLIWAVFTIIEPAHDKTNKMTRLPGKNQINMGIRPVWLVFAVHSMGCKELRFLRVDSENWSDRADAQVDLSLRWVHMSFCWFFHVAAHICSVATRTKVSGAIFGGPKTIVKGPSPILRESVTLNISNTTSYWRPSRPLVPIMLLGGEIASCPPLDTTIYIGKADILMTWLDHLNKYLFPKCLWGFIWNWVWIDPAVSEMFEESGRWSLPML